MNLKVLRSPVEWLRSSLWVPAVVSVTAAGALAAYLTRGTSVQGGWRYAFGYHGSTSDANDLLIGELTALVTTMTVAFSMALVALQVAATQFSPRLVRRWVRDTNTKVTLSVFLATISFALASLLGNSGESGDAPSIAITLSMVLVLASAASAVAYFHHIAQSMRIENIMNEIMRRGLASITVPREVNSGEAVGAHDRRDHSSTVRARRSGYLRGITDSTTAMRTLEECGVEVVLLRCRGDWIACGEDYARVGSLDALDEHTSSRVADALGDLVDLADDRPFDIEFDLAIRLLVDVAIKAISPAVNDPYTAVQAVHHLRTLVLQIAAHPAHQDPHGTRLRVPVPTLDDRLALACEQIIRSSDRSPNVLEAILDLLSSVSDVGQPSIAPQIDELTTLVTQVAEQMAFEHDRRHLASLLATFPVLPDARTKQL